MNLEKSFKKLLEHNPDYSTLTCFNIAIDGQKYSRMTIGKMFNKLVSTDDYGIENKDQIVSYCNALTQKEDKVNNED